MPREPKMISSPSVVTSLPDSPADSMRALLRIQQNAFQGDMSPSRAVRLDRLKRDRKSVV